MAKTVRVEGRSNPDLSGRECDRCGLHLPDQAFLIESRRSFSFRTTHRCPACHQHQSRQTEARLQLLFWAFILFAIALGPTLLPGITPVGYLLAGYLGGAFTGLIIHECAHALTAWVLGLRVWRIELGAGKRWASFSYRGLIVNLRRLPTIGYAVVEPSTGPWSAIRLGAVLAAGPASNLLVVAAASFVLWHPEWYRFSPRLAEFGGTFLFANLFLFAVALWPRNVVMEGGQLATDGKQLLDLLADLGRKHRRHRTDNAKAVRAHELLLRGQNQEALEAMESGGPPSHGPCTFDINRMVALIRLGRFAEACDVGFDLMESPELEPLELALIQNNTAWAGLLDGRRDQAVTFTDLVEAAIAALPTHPALRGTRGACAISMGHLDQGRKLIQQAMAQDVDGTFREIHLAWLAVAEASAGDHESAGELISASRQIEPESPEVDAILRYYLNTAN